MNGSPALHSWSTEVERLHRQIEQIENAVFTAERRGDGYALGDLRARLAFATRELEQAKGELLRAETAHIPLAPPSKAAAGRRARRW